jgi:hypothetical protein
MSGQWDINIDLTDLVDVVRERLPKALGKATEHLRSVVTPMVPKETGDLAGSGDVRVTSDTTAELFYPGPYALYQENGVYYRHGRVGAPLAHTTGQSFFIATGVVQAKAAMIQIIRDELLK